MQTVLLTGASGGIGQVLTGRLLSSGYTVVAVAGNNPQNIRPHKQLHLVTGDLASEEGVRSIHQQTVDLVGHPHIFIHNAGINANAMSWKLSYEDWNKVLAVNLNAAFLISSLCLPTMRELRWGRILYISSIVAQQGVAGTAAYAASKAGLLGMMRAQAAETAGRGITVNAIAPGYLNTGMIEEVPETIRENIRQRIPVGELGDPREMADLLLWLIGKNSGYVTGQTLHFNGGLFT